MCDAIFELDLVALLPALRQGGAVILSGVAIKVLDDYLDRRDWEDDRAAPAYALLALSAGVALAPGLASSLFLAAYAVGMLMDLDQRYPTGLAGWQEILIVVLGGLLLTGWREMLGSLALMVAVQSGDDLLDWTTDRTHGRLTMVNRLGFGECVFLGLLAVAMALCLAPGKTALVAGAAGLIWCGERVLRGFRRRLADQGGREEGGPG